MKLKQEGQRDTHVTGENDNYDNSAGGRSMFVFSSCMHTESPTSRGNTHEQALASMSFSGALSHQCQCQSESRFGKPYRHAVRYSMFEIKFLFDNCNQNQI